MTGFKHGYARPDLRRPEYRSWECARSRCRNANNPDYARYGGRGISFWPGWDKFEAFLDDMGPRPAGTTLDRIDTNGNYEPGNCRWADARQQGRNKSDNRFVTFQGATVRMVELAELSGVPYQRLHDRIVRRGWSPERAVTTPVRRWASESAA